MDAVCTFKMSILSAVLTQGFFYSPLSDDTKKQKTKKNTKNQNQNKNQKKQTKKNPTHTHKKPNEPNFKEVEKSEFKQKVKSPKSLSQPILL